MNPKFPWHVKGVRQQARETAREAARRSGLSVGEWLDSLIIESAVDEDEGAQPLRVRSQEERPQPPSSSAKVPGFDDPPSQRRPMGYNPKDRLVTTEQFARVSNRLDSLARDIDERERRDTRSELFAVNSRLETISRQLEQRGTSPDAGPTGFRERLDAHTLQVDPKRAPEADLSEVKARLDALTEQLDRRPVRAGEGDISEVKERLETLALTLDQRQSEALEAGINAVKTHVDTLAQQLDQRQSHMLDRGLGTVRERLDKLAAQFEKQQRKPADEDHLAAVNERLDMLVLAMDQLARATAPDPVQDGSIRPSRQQSQVAEAELDAVKERLDTLALQFDQRQNRSPDRDIAAVNDRLDTLFSAVDQLARNTGAEHPGTDTTARELTDAIARLDVRLDQLIAEGRTATSEIEQRVSAVDRAVAELNRGPRGLPADPSTPLDLALLEIAERQRMLDGEAASGVQRASTQDLTELRQQLRGISGQIETMRPCGIDAAVETLRNDLAEIGVMIKEALPRKAIEALESEVRALSEQIGDSRAGVASADVANLERGLAEVRDALRGLTPAESLVGLEEAVTTLSRKIDTVSVSQQDPATLEQLEGAISALRGIVAHVASNDALAKLGEDVRLLAAKLDHSSAADAFSILDQRIAAIADAMRDRNQAGQDTHALASVVEGLTDKFERLQFTRADQGAVGHLEDRIVNLVEKLDACDGRLVHLETVERGLAELLIHLEHQRLPAVVRGVAGDVESEALSREVKTLEAMHATLDKVVDRLAMVESGLRNQGLPKAAAAPPIAPAASEPEARSATPRQSVVPPRPAAIARPEAALAPAPTVLPLTAATLPMTAPGNPSPVAERRPIDPSLPPDHPLEPGVRARGNSPAERIAASQAALGKPPVIPDPSGKANFIAAARRAAKAAIAETPIRNDKSVPAPAANANGATPAAADGSLASRIGKRVRSLLVATSVVLIVLGGVHFAVNLFSASETTGTAPARPEPLPQRGEEPTAPEPTPPTPGRQSMINPAAPELMFGVPGVAGNPSALVRPVTVPSRSASPAADTVITGSVRQIEKPIDIQRPDSDKLPAGSTSLRSAASKGDAGAEYEMGVRYAEGRGVSQDFALAAEWFERASSQGVIPAQFRLGGLYEKGLGVKKDLEKARKLYVAAADAGSAKAMHNLAVLHAEGGFDGKPDFPAAAKWFRKAAEHGVTDSQYNLGILYARGIGVETNLVESYKWFALAAREGDKESAKKRDEVGTRIDAPALMSVRAATQIWAPTPQPSAAIEVKTPAGGWDDAAAPAPTPAPAPAPVPRRVAPKSDKTADKTADKTEKPKTGNADSGSRPALSIPPSLLSHPQ